MALLMSVCTPHKPDVSVIVPVHQDGESFRRCLESIAHGRARPAELIAVVDGHDPDAARTAEAFGARVLRTSSRSGPALARNVGAEAAVGDILFFVDADVAVAPDAVQQVAAVFGNGTDLAAAFGSYDDEPGEPNFLSQYKNLLHHYVHQMGDEEASTFWAGCGAVRREDFLAAGGFDARYRRPSIEDIELGYRLRRAGKRIRLCKSLLGKHLKRWTAGSLLRADFRDRALPWVELCLATGCVPNDLNLRTSSRVSVCSTYLLVALLVAGWWWPVYWGVAAGAALLLLVLNAPLYRFFWRKRGLGFTAMAVPWHWFYYFYGGLAFLIGLARHHLGLVSSRPGMARATEHEDRGGAARS